MSSDFESLSCDEEESRFVEHQPHQRRHPNAVSGSFDFLDDLVADQDARLLGCLPTGRDNNLLRHGLHDSDSDENDEAAAYGHRAYGVTGPRRRSPPPPPASHSLLHRFVLPSRASSRRHEQQQQQQQQQQASVPQRGPTKGVEGADSLKGSTAHTSVRLFTQPRKDSPELPRSSRSASPGTPPVPPVMPATVLAAEKAEEGGQRQAPTARSDTLPHRGRRGRRGRLPHRLPAPTAPATRRIPPSTTLAAGIAATPSRLWRATCPPDSGQITPVTSAATLTASATTRRSVAGEEEDDRDDDDGGDSTPPTAAADNVDLSVPREAPPMMNPETAPSLPAFSRTAVHDADGFYRTGLLENSSDGEDEAEGSGEHGGGLSRTAQYYEQHQQQQQQQSTPPVPAAMGSAAGVVRSTGGVSGGGHDAVQPTRMSNAAEDTQHVPPTANSAAATNTETQPSSFSPPASVGVPASIPATLRERLAVATAELQRVAAALPHMTTVHLLSLIITVLIPLNVLCLDVMAFSWIRRCVDVRYRDCVGEGGGARGASGSGLRCGASLDSGSASTTAPSSSTSSSYAAAAAQGRQGLSLPSAFPHSTKRGTTQVSSATTGNAALNATAAAAAAAAATSSGAGAASGKGVGTSAANTHAVPTLCCLVLWLMLPNGALVRLLLSRCGWARGGTASGEGNDVLWASYLYARLRRSAPQLLVMELYVRYACLWAMVHTATLLEDWMPVKINAEAPWPLSPSLASSVKARG